MTLIWMKSFQSWLFLSSFNDFSKFALLKKQIFWAIEATYKNFFNFNKNNSLVYYPYTGSLHV